MCMFNMTISISGEIIYYTLTLKNIYAMTYADPTLVTQNSRKFGAFGQKSEGNQSHVMLFLNKFDRKIMQ